MKRSLAGGPERLTLIAVLYGLSGALGLVYEVAFNKYLALVFGATAYASSAVLVAFMGGLALGAYLAGRVEHRLRRPLLAYALVELTIGAFCMLVPLTFQALSHVYVGAVAKNPDSLAMLSVVRAGLAVVVVLLPACGMGATLPLLARFVQREDPAFARRRLARFYAINTFGGAAGSLISAYTVIPALGLSWTMRTTAALSLGIGVVALVVGWSAWYPGTPHDAEEAPDAAEVPFRDALVLSAGSGLLVFGCEVVFVHLLALVIGTSVYAFGLMLAIFLVCLSLGTPLATMLARRFASGAPAIAFAIAGLALLASLIVWDRLPGLFIALGPSVRSWTARELTRGLAATLALIVPVVAMGTTFPLVLRAARARSVGADVGRLTVANTLGSIAGSIAGGFVVLPALGSQRGLIAIGLAYLAFAWFARRHAAPAHPSRARSHVTALVAAAVVLAVLLPRWNLARLTSGANVYFDEGVVPQGIVESSREDVHGGVTTVVRGADGTRTLLTNGKFQGNDTREVTDNRGFAHLPVVFAKHRSRAMVIGLGTGTSAGTMAAYDFSTIDIVELSPAIVDAARDVFGEVNRHVLDDPRVHVILEDGRNVLLTRKEPLDVVSVELTSVWFAGAGNLYNKEFYQLVSARLAEGGVLQQWFQLHHTNRRIVAATMASLRSVFPYVIVAVSGHQGQLLASREPLVVRREHVADLEAVGGVRATLEGGHLLDYVKRVLIDEGGVDRFLCETADRNSIDLADLVSTDDNMFLEYATPKTNVPSADDIPDTVGYLGGYKTRRTIPDHLRP
ncbi:fused MFS/spermidine synthase [soil metagenome]